MAVEKEYPGYNIVAEAWLNNPIGTAFWQGNSPLTPTTPTSNL